MRSFYWGALAALMAAGWGGVVRGQDAPVKVYKVGHDVTAAQLLPMDFAIANASECDSPTSSNEELAFIVDASGRARNVMVLHSGGIDFDRLAVIIVRADHFKPGESNGAPVAVSQSIKMKLSGCLASTSGPTGSASKRLRLSSQPEQVLEPYMSVPYQVTLDSGAEEHLLLYHVGGGVSAPVVMRAPSAEFSEIARKARYQGICLLTVIVDPRGMPQDIHIVRPLGMGLDEKAIEAVKQYQFKPGMLNGTIPVAVLITVEINFRL